jgi:hypothetical protein
MPKPQRLKANAEDTNCTNNLAREVKRIKLTRESSSTVTPAITRSIINTEISGKRSIDESVRYMIVFKIILQIKCIFFYFTDESRETKKAKNPMALT